MDAGKDGQMDGQAGGWVYDGREVVMDGWMRLNLHGWLPGLMDGQMDGRKEG